jgi:hypothetical protein
MVWFEVDAFERVLSGLESLPQGEGSLERNEIGFRGFSGAIRMQSVEKWNSRDCGSFLSAMPRNLPQNATTETTNTSTLAFRVRFLAD